MCRAGIFVALHISTVLRLKFIFFPDFRVIIIVVAHGKNIKIYVNEN